MKKKIITVCAAVLFLTALGLTLYPLISNYVNQKYASEIQTAYQELIQQTDNSVLQEAKQRAIAYNLVITPGTADAYSEEALLSAAEDYDNQLDIAGNGIMGYVIIPKIQVNLGNSTAALLMILTMLPAFLLALYEKNGQHLEVIIRNMVRVLFLRPKERPYRTNNFYAVLERQDNLDKEVYRIVHPSQKARTEKSGAGRYLKGKAHR